MSKNKAYTRNEHLLSTKWKFVSEIGHFVSLPKLNQNSRKWMLFFFEPTIVVKTNVKSLQSPPPPSFNADI